jgi:DNA-directed RNA polymerase specialized sigma24 family protein
MSSASSVSDWIDQLKAGDAVAAQKIWEQYYTRLLDFARTKLRAAPRRVADEEDVTLSAFDSFVRGAQQQRFPQLTDRNDLWQLLLVITERKAVDLLQYEKRLKRGGGKSPLELTRDDDSAADGPAIGNLPSREPTPTFAAQAAEELERLLDLLDDAELRSIALWKMEGYSNDEISTRLGYVSRTVERKLSLIRKIWSREGRGPRDDPNELEA